MSNSLPVLGHLTTARMLVLPGERPAAAVSAYCGTAGGVGAGAGLPGFVRVAGVLVLAVIVRSAPDEKNRTAQTNAIAAKASGMRQPITSPAGVRIGRASRWSW